MWRIRNKHDLIGTIIYDQCCGSGIHCLFDPWIWDPGWVKNQNPNPG
jgi:hypothetical protein